jgi:hypothetical protein
MFANAKTATVFTETQDVPAGRHDENWAMPGIGG